MTPNLYSINHSISEGQGPIALKNMRGPRQIAGQTHGPDRHVARVYFWRGGGGVQA